jgi:hypothetical protein
MTGGTDALKNAAQHAAGCCAAAKSASASASERLDVVIISWQGQHENAAHIAQALNAVPELRVVVIYSNAAEAVETGAGEWIQVPNAFFFGWKFRRALDCVRQEAPAMVIVQADARAADWAGLLARCSGCFQRMPGLGLWTPRISYTPWTPGRVDIAPVPGTDLMHVAQTDGIVLALARPVVERLRQLDYDANNLGWGIDSLAIAFSFANGLMVVRDDGGQVQHPQCRGYDRRLALQQWRQFLLQMTDAEMCIHAFIGRFTEDRTPTMRQRLKGLRRRLRARLASAVAGAFHRALLVGPRHPQEAAPGKPRESLHDR